MEFSFEQNATVDSLDKVPEQFRPMYVEGEGGYQLSEAHQGVAKAIDGLNGSLRAARAEAKAKKGPDLSPLKDYGETPEEIAEKINATIAELNEKAGDKPNIDKIKEDLSKQHTKELEKVSKRAEALQNQLYETLVENAATSAISAAKGIPELLMPFVKNNIKVTETDGKFQVGVVDGDGDVRYSSATGQPMTIAELVNEMKQDSKYGRLFESEAPAGGAAKPGGGTGKAPIQKGADMSPVDKIKAGLNRRTATAR